MDELLSGTEQYYLKRLQLANWGTFSGIYTIDIAQRGHLFVGGSGSGKSTILDAMSVLLTPGRINFNAAARGRANRTATARRRRNSCGRGRPGRRWRSPTRAT